MNPQSDNLAHLTTPQHPVTLSRAEAMFLMSLIYDWLAQESHDESDAMRNMVVQLSDPGALADRIGRAALTTQEQNVLRLIWETNHFGSQLS